MTVVDQRNSSPQEVTSIRDRNFVPVLVERGLSAMRTRACLCRFTPTYLLTLIMILLWIPSAYAQGFALCEFHADGSVYCDHTCPNATYACDLRSHPGACIQCGCCYTEPGNGRICSDITGTECGQVNCNNWTKLKKGHARLIPAQSGSASPSDVAPWLTTDFLQTVTKKSKGLGASMKFLQAYLADHDISGKPDGSASGTVVGPSQRASRLRYSF